MSRPTPSHPSFPLGVALMDDDHAHIEDMLRMVPNVPDEGLLNFLAEVRQEIADHFAREEELMRTHRVPVLECHIAQHARLIHEMDDVTARAAAMPRAALRTFLGRDLVNLVMSHIASVDQISARFLRGELDEAMTGRLRLPVEA